MKPAHLAPAAHHTSAANRNSQANAGASDKTAANPNDFAQMLLSGLEEAADPNALAPEDTPVAEASTEASDPSALTTTAEDPAPLLSDPTTQQATPAQAMMAMLAQIQASATTQSASATQPDATSTPSSAADGTPAATTSATPATTLDGSPVLNPAGRALPEQAVAQGLQDKAPDATPTTGNPTTDATPPKAPKQDFALPEQANRATDTSKHEQTVGRRVSTAAKDAALSGPPPRSLATLQGLEATVSWHMTTPGQPGNALASSELTTVAGENSGSTTSPIQSNDTSTSGEGAGQQQGNSDPSLAGTDALGATNDTASATPSATDNSFAMSLGEALGDAFESLGAQVSFWAAQNTKRASMNLDAGLDSPLTVDVALDQGQVQLAFRTDDAAAQAAIKSHAQAALSDLLARSGIGLAGLSVGAQTAQGQGGQPQHQGQNGWQGLNRALDRVTTAQDTAAATRVTTLRNRSGLDVYA